MEPSSIDSLNARRRAIFMLVGSSSLFGLMAFAAKMASADLDGGQVAMVRFVVTILPILLYPPFRRAALTFHRFDLLFYRGFFGGIAVLFYFLAIQHSTVGTATLLNYTSPIWAGLFATLFIGEPIRPRAIIPLAVAFLGVVLVVRSHAGPNEFGVGRWELVALFSAMLSGAAVTAIRFARRTEGSWAIFASFSFFGLLATAPVGIWQWRWPTPVAWLWLILVGVLSIGAQLMMTHAYKWVDTLTAGVMAQWAVVVSMILGAVILGDTINALGAIGSALTIGGVIAVMVFTGKPKPSAFDEAAEQ
ncbi:MAG: DMT family transporter [Thermoanaerobaculia bacterium]